MSTSGSRSISQSPSPSPSPSRAESPASAPTPSGSEVAQQIIESYRTLDDKLWEQFVVFESIFTEEWRIGRHPHTTFQQWALRYIPGPIIIAIIELHFSSLHDALTSRHKDYINRLVDLLETGVWELYFAFGHYTLHSRHTLETLVHLTKSWPEVCLEDLLDHLRFAREERISSKTRGQRISLWSFQPADAKAAKSSIEARRRSKKKAGPGQLVGIQTGGVEKGKEKRQQEEQGEGLEVALEKRLAEGQEEGQEQRQEEGQGEEPEEGLEQRQQVSRPGSLQADTQNSLLVQPTSLSSNQRQGTPAREPSPEARHLSLDDRQTTPERAALDQETSDLSIELPRANTRLKVGEPYEEDTELLDNSYRDILDQQMEDDSVEGEDWQSVDFRGFDDNLDAGFSDTSQHSDVGQSESVSHNLGDLPTPESDMSGQAHARGDPSPRRDSTPLETGLLSNIIISRKTSRSRSKAFGQLPEEKKDIRMTEASTSTTANEASSPGSLHVNTASSDIPMTGMNASVQRLDLQQTPHEDSSTRTAWKELHVQHPEVTQQWKRMITNHEMLRDDLVHFLSCSANCSPDILVLHPLYIQMTGRATLVKNAAKFLQYRLLVVPLYHPGAIHFSLAVIEVATRTMSHYDSITSPKRFSETKKHVYPWLAGLFADMPDPLTLTASSVKCFQQSDGVSCGLIVAAWAKAISENRPILSSFDVEELRDSALKRLGDIETDPNSTPYSTVKRTTDVIDLEKDDELEFKEKHSSNIALDSPVAVLDAIQSHLSQAWSLVVDFQSARRDEMATLQGAILSNQALETSIRSTLPQLSAKVRRALDDQHLVSETGRKKRQKLNIVETFLSPLQQIPEGVDDDDLGLIKVARETTLENLRDECVASDRKLEVMAAEIKKAKEDEERSGNEVELLKESVDSGLKELEETRSVFDGEQGFEGVVGSIYRTVEIFKAWKDNAKVAKWREKAGEAVKGKEGEQ